MFGFLSRWLSPEQDPPPAVGLPLGQGPGERDGVIPLHDDRTNEPRIKLVSALRRVPPRAV